MLRRLPRHHIPLCSRFLSSLSTDKLLKVAIVGPPNAGKSTLFNRFLKTSRSSKRLLVEKKGRNRGKGGVVGRAIVSDVAGTTRDRRETIGNLAGVQFKIFDTAGVDDDVMGSSFSAGKRYRGAKRKGVLRNPSTEKDIREDIVLRGMAEQTLAAIDLADVIFFLFDGRSLIQGASEGDVVEMSRWLRRHRKSGDTSQVVLCANKLEGDAWAQMGGGDTVLEEMGRLGFGEPLLISAEHGDGMAEIASILVEAEKRKKEELGVIETEDDDDYSWASSDAGPETINMAILGRQNVGKSTLLNALVSENRVITGSVPGLTRDSIAVDFEFEGRRRFNIVDTAGIRRASRRERDGDSIEDDSVSDAMRSLKVAHVCVLVLEAEKLHLTKQELTICDTVIKEGRALVIVANKSDTLSSTPSEYAMGVKDQVDRFLPHVGDVIVVATSSLNGENVEHVLPIVESVFERWNSRVTTGELNNWFKDVVISNPPPMSKGRITNLKYIVQAKSRPPTFRIFGNIGEKELGEGYIRYIRNNMRRSFGMEGMAIRIGVTNTSDKNPFVGKGKAANR